MSTQIPKTRMRSSRSPRATTEVIPESPRLSFPPRLRNLVSDLTGFCFLFDDGNAASPIADYGPRHCRQHQLPHTRPTRSQRRSDKATRCTGVMYICGLGRTARMRYRKPSETPVSNLCERSPTSRVSTWKPPQPSCVPAQCFSGGLHPNLDGHRPTPYVRMTTWSAASLEGRVSYQELFSILFGEFLKSHTPHNVSLCSKFSLACREQCMFTACELKRFTG